MKYCKDCKHFTRMSERAIMNGGEFCARPVWIEDVVNGSVLRNPVPAREERTTKLTARPVVPYQPAPPVFCGINAQYFEDKGDDE